LVGIYTAYHRHFGIVILSFHDLRHSISAQKSIHNSQHGEIIIGAEFLSRSDIELIDTSRAKKFLSSSEGILVIKVEENKDGDITLSGGVLQVSEQSRGFYLPLIILVLCLELIVWIWRYAIIQGGGPR
jgi:hypothetical protein